MMSPSSSFWPNFMASPASYPHPTYLPTSPNEYSDWMHHHHHHAYRSPYSSNSTGVSGAATMSNNHLHPIGSPNSTNNNNNNNANNTGRYHHHHTPSDMDVVRVAAIGVAAAAQMFHHDKQSHHAYTPASHHFDYHLGGSMMATASYAFPTQSRTNIVLSPDLIRSVFRRFRFDGFRLIGHRSRQFEYEGSINLVTLVHESSSVVLINTAAMLMFTERKKKCRKQCSRFLLFFLVDHVVLL